MSVDHWLTLLNQYGYAVLFFSLWLGLIGPPIPGEVIVLTGGAAAGSGAIAFFPALLAAYMGVVSGLTFGYGLGRRLGFPLLNRIGRRRSIDKSRWHAERFIGKYGSLSLVFSYFVPVIRHMVPYGAGANRLSYRRFAIYAYSGGLVWTLIIFLTGSAIGGHIQEIGYSLYHDVLRILWLVVVTCAVCWILHAYRVKAKD